jgi:transcriptional regulator with XRE-family HTH domain
LHRWGLSGRNQGMFDRRGPVTLIEALRVRRGLTIFEVEAATGVSHKTIKNYETATTLRPATVSLRKLASFYDADPVDLLEDIRRRHHERTLPREAAA